MMIEDMKLSIVGQLTPYLRKTDKAFDEELLSSVVDGVLADARIARRYPTSYTEDMILNDMEKGLGIFRNVALSRYNKIGVEFERTHNEGEVSRSYVDYGKEWSGWLPLAVSL